MLCNLIDCIRIDDSYRADIRHPLDIVRIIAEVFNKKRLNVSAEPVHDECPAD